MLLTSSTLDTWPEYFSLQLQGNKKKKETVSARTVLLNSSKSCDQFQTPLRYYGLESDFSALKALTLSYLLFCDVPSAQKVMEAEVWHIREYQAALLDETVCTPAQMARHFDRLLKRLHVEVLANGNVARSEAVGLGPAISAALSEPELLPEEELPTRHALKLPAGGGDVVLELEAATEDENNSAVLVRWLMACYVASSSISLVGCCLFSFSLFALWKCVCRSGGWSSLVLRCPVSLHAPFFQHFFLNAKLCEIVLATFISE